MYLLKIQFLRHVISNSVSVGILHWEGVVFAESKSSQPVTGPPAVDKVALPQITGVKEIFHKSVVSGGRINYL